MVFGIALMLLLSFKGLGDAKDIAAENEKGQGEKTEEVASSPEDIYKKSCIGCHGDQYQGVVGPKLKGVGEKLSQDEIKSILTNGKGTMPKNLVAAEHVDEMAKWLAELK
jgi:cytochrome c550